MSPLLGTFSAGSVRGFRGNVRVSTGLEPEYWWRADSGLSTSTWTAYKGGLDFTFTNVTSADSTNGVYLNGTNGRGITGTISSTIDAKHIFIRGDSVDGSAGRTILGGTQNGIHEWYYTNDIDDWYIVEMNTAGSLIYAASTGAVGTRITWTDLVNYTAPRYFLDTSTTGTDLAVYFGTYPNRFRWEAAYAMWLGARGTAGTPGSFFQGYIKEVAIFTTSLTDTQAKSFRSTMDTRWP